MWALRDMSGPFESVLFLLSFVLLLSIMQYVELYTVLPDDT